MDVIFLVIGVIVLTSLSILKDWLIYKHRGKGNPPIITGLEDARAQRLIDLYTEHQSDQLKK